MPVRPMICTPASSRIAAGVAIGSSVGVSLTLVTASVNVVDEDWSTPATVLPAVIVMSVVPLASAAGVMVSVREVPVPETPMFASGTTAVVVDAKVNAMGVVASPTSNVVTSGVSSSVL